MIFGDLGAEVMKLEAPVGDWSRVYRQTLLVRIAAIICLSIAIKSIVVDMKQRKGWKLFVVLRMRVIFWSRISAGVLDRLGLTYDELFKRNQGLIWASISGFGQTKRSRSTRL